MRPEVLLQRADRFLSPAQLARALGLSESTVKRWIDQGEIRAEKTPGGHRRIRLADAADLFRRSRGRGFDPGVLAGEDASPESLSVLLASESPESAEKVIETAFVSGVGAAELADRWIAPAMESLGTGWQAGTLTVTREHRATSAMLRAVHGLLRNIPEPGAEAPLAFVAGLSRDPYLLAPLCAQLVLAEAGYRAENFGPDTPAESLEDEIRQQRPALVALSFSVTASRPRARLGDACREAGSALIVGGRALRPDLVKALDATAWCRSMEEFGRIARHLLRQRTELAAQPALSAAGKGSR